MSALVEFKSTLDKFHAGAISYAELLITVQQLTDKEPSVKSDILTALDEEYQTGRLPVQLHLALCKLVNEAVSVCQEEDSGQTRVATSAKIDELESSASRTSVFSSLPKEDGISESSIASSNSLDSSLGKVDLGFPIKPLKIGTLLKNQYVLEQELGAGGMGIVFKARDLLMEEMRDRDPYVAIKILRPELRNNKALLIALQREFRKSQKLTHPNIIHVMDFTRDLATGYVFLSMEFLHGKTLGQVISEHSASGLAFNKAWPIITAMADALAYAHRNHIVHMDFKPGNVFLTESGEIKVLDFGIANVMGVASHDSQNTVFNPQDLGALTPAYASLEMLENLSLEPKDRHLPDARDDIYALGCVTYEVLTGQHPFGKASAMDAHRSRLQAKPPACLSRRQWRGLKRALAFERGQRTASVEEFIHEVGTLSPWFWRSIAGLGIAGTVIGLVIFLFPHTVAECYPPELTPEANTRIKDLLEVAAVHLEVGFLTAPPASNALLAYQEVLKINPCNLDAKNGLEKIANELEQSAWAAFEKGNRAISLEKVEDGLKAQPNHTGLLSLRNKLRY